MQEVFTCQTRARFSPVSLVAGLFRYRLMAMALLASVLLPVANAQENRPAQLTVEDKTLTTEDGVDLKLTYYKSAGGQAAPVVILLHGKAGNRQNWKKVAEVLQEKAGFAVITVDLRGHGDTQIKTKKLDYQAMALGDLEAVKNFIFEEHQAKRLNMNKLGIVGCEFSAAVAMFYTEFDWLKEPFDDSIDPDQRTRRGQDVKALVLISPDTTTQGVFPSRTASALRTIDRLSVMIAASEKSGHDLSTSRKLFDQISAKRVKSDQIVLNRYPEDVVGMNLVWQDDKLKEDIGQFLVKHVHDAESSWQDRRSRVDRE